MLFNLLLPYSFNTFCLPKTHPWSSVKLYIVEFYLLLIWNKIIRWIIHGSFCCQVFTGLSSYLPHLNSIGNDTATCIVLIWCIIMPRIQMKQTLCLNLSWLLVSLNVRKNIKIMSSWVFEVWIKVNIRFCTFCHGLTKIHSKQLTTKKLIDQNTNYLRLCFIDNQIQTFNFDYQ